MCRKIYFFLVFNFFCGLKISFTREESNVLTSSSWPVSPLDSRSGLRQWVVYTLRLVEMGDTLYRLDSQDYPRPGQDSDIDVHGRDFSSLDFLTPIGKT